MIFHDAINEVLKKKRKSPKIVSDFDIKEAYIELGNVWKAGEKLGIAGQTVYSRLVKLGIRMKKPPISEKEKQCIREFYEKGFLSGSGELKKFSLSLGRTVPLISRTAKEMNLTNMSRKLCPTLCDQMSKRSKKWHSENEHPKGMLGKNHTKEYSLECGRRASKLWNQSSQKEKNVRICKSLMTRLKNFGSLAPQKGGKDVSWKQGWRVIGGVRKFYRSRWEANYARYLEFQKINGLIKDWKHEPETFWFPKILRGVRCYLPDFKIYNLDGSHYWVEVKGYYDDRSKTKIKRFKKYHKEEKLVLVDGKWFAKNARKISGLINDWEYGSKYA